MDRFSKLNPKATLLFFLLAIVEAVSFFNPIFLFANLLLALSYNIILQGLKALRMLFTFILPLIIFAGAFNMLFTDYGNTIFFTIGQKAFTLEGLLYGLTQGLMLGDVLIWISSYSLVLSSDKLLSVFSGIAPDISLTLSMILSFIPRLRKNAAEINDARAIPTKNESRLKKSIGNLSALITLTLEESIELSDSMRARGFGKKRSVYSKYKFGARDMCIMIICGVLFILSIIFKALYQSQFIFEPDITVPTTNAGAIITYCLMCALPLIIDFTEDMRWLYLKSKI